MRRVLALVLAAFVAVGSPGWAQSAEAVAQERAAYRAWLTTAPNSPFAAVAQLPLIGPVFLGPADSDVPLPGLDAHTIEDGRTVRLRGPGGRRSVPRNRLLPLGPYRMYLGGTRGRTVLTVFDTLTDPKPPSHFAYDSSLVFRARLVPPEEPGTVRLLALDGVEVEATEAGTFRIPLGPNGTDLRVRRVPNPGMEESELEIFFRDHTNDRGTYPAGRFVSLIPLGGGRYVLDLNRARNPFCAYNSAYPCPIPWRGNAIDAPVEAGERYEGGGLEIGPSEAP